VTWHCTAWRVAAAAVLLVVVTACSARTANSDAPTAYQQKVAAAFAPLRDANQQFSRELGSVSGTFTKRALDAIRAAQHAQASASGAVDALSPPAGSQTLADNARQVLDREDAYLSALSAVLGDPSNPSRGELITLQSNLQSALTAAGPVVAGSNPSLSGATDVTAWAPQAAAARAHPAPSAASTSSSSSPQAPGNPYSNGRDCGDGIYAGPNTSCSFAFNVREAWRNAPGTTNSVTVYSPVTGRDYVMSCAPSGVAISCSGGNSAAVTFGY
jgi:hypothetical protein